MPTYEETITDSMVLSEAVTQEFTPLMEFVAGLAVAGSAGSTWSLTSEAADGIAMGDTLANVVTTMLADTLRMGETVTSTLAALLLDGLTFSDTGASTLTAESTAADGLELSDSLRATFRALLADGLVLGDTTSAQRTALLGLIDGLVLTGAVGSQLAAINAVATTLALGDTLSSLQILLLTDQVVFNEALGAALRGRMSLVDGVVIGDAAPNVTLVAAIADTIELGDVATSSATLLQLLRDGVTFQARIRIDGQTLLGYVCNAETLAMSEYTGLSWNGFARIGGRYYATSDAGLFRLEGDDDDGTAIAARIRTGLTTMGTGRMKRLLGAYLGYTSTGQLVLKVITTSAGGEKEENWYQMVAQPANAPREGRIKVGRGLASAYWSFEICNTDGADFALDVVALHPMILNGRI